MTDLYDMIKCTQKLTNSQLNLLHGTQRKKGIEKTKKAELLRRSGK